MSEFKKRPGETDEQYCKRWEEEAWPEIKARQDEEIHLRYLRLLRAIEPKKYSGDGFATSQYHGKDLNGGRRWHHHKRIGKGSPRHLEDHGRQDGTSTEQTEDGDTGESEENPERDN